MRSALLTYVTSLFDEHISSQLAEATNENPHQVHTILSTLIPASLSGMLNSAGQSNEGIQKLMDMSLAADNEQPWSGPNFSLKGPLFDNNAHYFDELLDHLGGLGKISGNLSDTVGVKSNSIAHIWKWIGPMILAALGRFVREEKMNLTEFSSLVHRERKEVQEAVAPAVEKVTQTDALVPEKKKSNVWLPLILLLVLIGIFWFAMRGCEPSSENSTHVDSIHAIDTGSRPSL